MRKHVVDFGQSRVRIWDSKWSLYIELAYHSLENSIVGPLSVIVIFLSVVNDLLQVLLLVKDTVGIGEVAQFIHLRVKS